MVQLAVAIEPNRGYDQAVAPDKPKNIVLNSRNNSEGTSLPAGKTYWREEDTCKGCMNVRSICIRNKLIKCLKIIEPLQKLLKKEVKWEWTDKQEQAFTTVKHLLTTAPILACPNFRSPFQLETDATDTGLGAVLTQNINGENFVISFASRSLNSTERKYSASEKECLAVVWAIRKFRPYSEGYSFKVITDHIALKWHHNLKNPTGRLARWALELLEYDYEIMYRKGSLNHVPDALSRSSEKDIKVSNILASIKETEENDFKEIEDNWYKTKMIHAAVLRSGISAAKVQEVYMGNVCQAAVGQAPARQSTLFAVKQPPINETPEEKLVRREEEEKMRKEEIERAMQKEIKKIRDRKLIEERFEMYNEYGSRRGVPRIKKKAEEKGICYNLPTMEEIRKGIKERKIKEKEEKDKQLKLAKEKEVEEIDEEWRTHRAKLRDWDRENKKRLIKEAEERQKRMEVQKEQRELEEIAKLPPEEATARNKEFIRNKSRKTQIKEDVEQFLAQCI
ncbi:uncharacterized protein LOC117169706 [Belonocnema kinseyi]|uniref:uncharacterized protein LOC117169706 n=1 Tax=Belonocnema kinseyi TaxID=2817044 RepID=UPI00143DC6CE|nr:uncharacterized protein LOC117169706 [Belonocnema kinseyi]